MRKKRLPLFAAFTTIAAVAVALVASSAFAHEPGTTLNPGHVGANSMTFKVGDKCEQDRLEHGATGGQVLWHFILNQVDDINTGVLTTDFLTQNGGVPFDTDYVDQGNNIAWWVITDGHDTLQAAHTDATTDGGNLNLSHVCPPVKASPGLTTLASPPGKTGDALVDTASLTGGFMPPSGDGGTVTFTLYGPNDADCSDPIYSNTVAVVWDADGTSEPASDDDNDGLPANGNVALAVGSYQWIASYSGNDQNNAIGATSCSDPAENTAITAAAPTVETEIHLLTEGSDTDPVTVIPAPFEVALGSTVHDQGKVSGPAALGTPTGTVYFTFYTTIDCDDSLEEEDVPTGVPAGSVAVDASGIAHPSDNEGPLGAGSYSFSAHFDSSNENVWSDSDSLCEPLTVNKGQLRAATILHSPDPDHDVIPINTPLKLGSQLHDTAQIGGVVAGFEPENDVTFKFFMNGTCGPRGGTDAPNIGDDEDTDDPRTADTAPLAPGSYSFQATIEGDDNYLGATSGCEPFSVDKGNLEIVTYIHDTLHNVITFAPNNSTVHDTAVLSGAVAGFPVDLTMVSFAFYNTINCTGDSVVVATDGNEGANIAKSAAVGPLGSGAYSFKASFAGDAYYNLVRPAAVACEPLSIRTFGKTMGFWGNNNGQARILANGGYGANVVDIGRGGVINTQAESLKVLPNTKNACGRGNPPIFTGAGGSTANADCLVNAGINKNSLNTLAAQTLALGYNLKPALLPGFSGQPLAAFGCDLTGTGLTGLNTVNDAFTAAVALINGSYAGATTQAQIGAMNSLLGCVNAEA